MPAAAFTSQEIHIDVAIEGLDERDALT